MRKFVGFVTLAAVSMVWAGIATAETKIAVMDTQWVMQSTNAAKRADEKMTKRQTETQKKVKDMQAPLLAERQRLEEQSSMLSPEQRLEKQSEWRKKMRQLQAEVQSLDEELNREGLSLRAEIVEAVKEVAQDIAKERGFDIVLPANLLLYVDDSVNISEETLKRVNAKLDK